jgi:hypothetical protein
VCVYISHFYHHCEPIPDIKNLKEERFVFFPISSHGHSALCFWAHVEAEHDGGVSCGEGGCSPHD